MDIQLISPADPAARRLIAASDTYMQALYPSESNHLESVEALMAPNVAFFGCHIGAVLVACGAAKILRDDGNYGEIKRVFVTPTSRGKGISIAIMQRLETHLLANGIDTSRLETGIHQPEALGLYEKLGYVYRSPFGNYQLDPLSVFMEKKLATI
jgi:putative acetyltransferase